MRYGKIIGNAIALSLAAALMSGCFSSGGSTDSNVEVSTDSSYFKFDSEERSSGEVQIVLYGDDLVFEDGIDKKVWLRNIGFESACGISQFDGDMEVDLTDLVGGASKIIKYSVQFDDIPCTSDTITFKAEKVTQATDTETGEIISVDVDRMEITLTADNYDLGDYSGDKSIAVIVNGVAPSNDAVVVSMQISSGNAAPGQKVYFGAGFPKLLASANLNGPDVSLYTEEPGAVLFDRPDHSPNMGYISLYGSSVIFSAGGYDISAAAPGSDKLVIIPSPGGSDLSYAGAFDISSVASGSLSLLPVGGQGIIDIRPVNGLAFAVVSPSRYDDAGGTVMSPVFSGPTSDVPLENGTVTASFAVSPWALGKDIVVWASMTDVATGKRYGSASVVTLKAPIDPVDLACDNPDGCTETVQLKWSGTDIPVSYSNVRITCDGNYASLSVNTGYDQLGAEEYHTGSSGFVNFVMQPGAVDENTTETAEAHCEISALREFM